jgi:HEPN domain-containing protein
MSDQNLGEAQRWLQQAKHDFDVVQWSAKGGYWSHVCFMAQQ